MTAVNDVSFVPGPFAGLLVPVMGFDPTSAGTHTANAARGVRCVAMRSGFIRDVSFHVVTQSGNIDVGIYDCGDTTPAVRTRLWSSGSTACGAAGIQTIDPGASTVACRAGQHFDLFLSADNGVASFVGFLSGTAAGNQFQMPASFLTGAVSALAKVGFTASAVFPLPSSIAEASVVAAGQPRADYVYARIA